jgi:hypothetical protein
LSVSFKKCFEIFNALLKKEIFILFFQEEKKFASSNQGIERGYEKIFGHCWFNL